LTTKGIHNENDLAVHLNSNESFDELVKQMQLSRAKDSKDLNAKSRLDKLLTKFEKLWREKSGIKKPTAQTKRTESKVPKKEETADEQGKKSALKQWMQKNNCWEKDLHLELIANNVQDENQIKEITQAKFDLIVRKVRVQRLSELKDEAARQRLDKILITFENQWRTLTGTQKNSVSSNAKTNTNDDDNKEVTNNNAQDDNNTEETKQTDNDNHDNNDNGSSNNNDNHNDDNHNDDNHNDDDHNNDNHNDDNNHNDENVSSHDNNDEHQEQENNETNENNNSNDNNEEPVPSDNAANNNENNGNSDDNANDASNDDNHDHNDQ